MRKVVVVAILAALVLTTPVFAQASAPWGQFDGHAVVRVMVNGSPVKGDIPAFIYGTRTLAPIRLVAEAFGAKVDWDGST